MATIAKAIQFERAFLEFGLRMGVDAKTSKALSDAIVNLIETDEVAKEAMTAKLDQVVAK